MGEFYPRKFEDSSLVLQLNCEGGRIFYYYDTCPPTSHTVKLIFLYSTVSTLNPEVESDINEEINHEHDEIL